MNSLVAKILKIFLAKVYICLCKMFVNEILLQLN